jgi:hypothetical protein
VKTTRNAFGSREEIQRSRERWRRLSQFGITERTRESPEEKPRALDQLYALAKSQGWLQDRED